MIINCGFQLKISKRHYEFKNIQKIYVPDNMDDSEIRKELMKHKPSEENWTITGYCFVGDRIIEEGRG